jgi:DNA-nicking Smr family endonuclease
MTSIPKQQLDDWLEETANVKKLKNKNSHVEKSEFFYTTQMHFSNLKLKSEIDYTASMLATDKSTNADFKTKYATHSQDDIKSARRSVDKRLQLKLKNGQIKYQDKIDLHGMTLAEANKKLVYFLQTRQQIGLKCVLVVHGKGTNQLSNIGQIKQQIPYWLENLDCVLSFSSATPKHGGTGAIYVLLRKTKNS